MGQAGSRRVCDRIFGCETDYPSDALDALKGKRSSYPFWAKGCPPREALCVFPAAPAKSCDNGSGDCRMFDYQWDVFISHASEDKETVAGPLAAALRRAGVRVWLDANELTLGDGLRGKIDEGLAHSRYGVVILSPAFFGKDWPQNELSGLVAREEALGKVVLPIWHHVDKEFIARYSPLLADRLGISTKKGIEQVCDAVLLAIGEPAPITMPPREARRGSTMLKIAAAALLIGFVAVSWTRYQGGYRTQRLSDLFASSEPTSAEAPPAALPGNPGEFPDPLPFTSGWIFVGYYSRSNPTFIEGPYAEVVWTSAEQGITPGIPGLGDVLIVRKSRRVIIGGFKTSGLEHQMTSPALVSDTITEEDETGVQIPERSLLFVRDVEVSGYRERPVSVWCRVVACDAKIPQCASAVNSRRLPLPDAAQEDLTGN